MDELPYEILPPPVVRLPPDDDKFCVAFSLTGSITEAYRLAYPIPAGMSRAELTLLAQKKMAEDAIAFRLDALQLQFSRCAGITKAGHLMTLAEIRDRAMAVEDLAIAMQCEKLRGQAAGYYAEVTAKSSRAITDNSIGGTDLSKLSDEEIAALAEMVQKARGGVAAGAGVTQYEEKSVTMSIVPHEEE